MKHEEDFESLRTEILGDTDARAAALENTLRSGIGAALEAARLERGLSLRQLATQVGTSLSQVQRLLHREIGGSLTLRTICRAADQLGLTVSMNVQRTPLVSAKVWISNRNRLEGRSLSKHSETEASECLLVCGRHQPQASGELWLVRHGTHRSQHRSAFCDCY